MATVAPLLNLTNVASFVKDTAALALTDGHTAIKQYKDIFSFLKHQRHASESPEDPTAAEAMGNETVLRLEEDILYALAQLYVQTSQTECIKELLVESRHLFAVLPKARTAKMVRTIIDLVSRVPHSLPIQQELCQDCITWCIKEKRTFLRLRVETRLALLYLQQNKLQAGLSLVDKLLKEVKKLDDKLLLVEIYLVESKLHFTLQNMAKSKAALTAARTNANAIHCPPSLQGDLDMLAGMLHTQEKDAKTAFSYFFEALEAYATLSASTSTYVAASSSGDTDRAQMAFKYMLLAKIICGQPEEVFVLLAGKYGLKYSDSTNLEFLKAIAKCYKERSLKMFESVLVEYKEAFEEDAFVKYHINELNETFLEQNLTRVLEPFSKVEVDHVAKLVGLPIERVENKLSEMILDKKLMGTLDQGVGVLILFEKATLPDFYEDVLATINNMANVVDTLYEKAQ